MHYVIETKEQLSFLQAKNFKECFVCVIPNHNMHHPALQEISLIYFRPINYKHGFILVLNHNEGFSLHKHTVKSFINDIEKIYTLNKKDLMYFFNNKNIFDLNFVNFINKNPIIFDEDFNLNIHTNYYSKYGFLSNINHIIPIAKHYEKYENLYNKIKLLFDQADSKNVEYNFYNFELTEAFYNIEKQGIELDFEQYTKHFDLNNTEYSVKNTTIYSQYNLYNTTLRPSNTFNGLNFAALNKDNGERKAFIAKNDYFVEFDYKAFHLYILCKLINYTPQDVDIHTELGKIYFNKSELTPEEYKESKQKTFHILYTDEIKKYTNIEFFAKAEQFKKSMWDEYKSTGKIQGIITSFNTLNSPTQILPYLFQNYETFCNTLILNKIHRYLKDKQTKLVLYLYDAFIFDVSKEDNSNILQEITQILESEGFKCGTKMGTTLHSLRVF